jgi:hypothetical protein
MKLYVKDSESADTPENTKDLESADRSGHDTSNGQPIGDATLTYSRDAERRHTAEVLWLPHDGQQLVGRAHQS